MAILIAYYSRAGENYFGGSYRRIPVGNTRRVAEQLASLTGGDLLELRQAHPYSDDYRTCVAQARADWQQSVRPELLGLPKDLAGYDRIYLGYPNYCGTMPMAVYTFLEHYDFTGKVICPFCTHEGSGLSQTEQDIRKAAPGGHRHPWPCHPRQPRGRGRTGPDPVGQGDAVAWTVRKSGGTCGPPLHPTAPSGSSRHRCLQQRM